MEEAEYCDRIALIYGGNMIAMDTPLALKTRFMRDEILDLRCKAPQDIIEALGKLPEIQDIALFGAGLHIVVPAGKAASAEVAISRELEALGVKIERLEKIMPGMEDVFVSLIEQVDRQEKEQKASGVPA
jgi:ABC-2 type transport system ATP-binding protein